MASFSSLANKLEKRLETIGSSGNNRAVAVASAILTDLVNITPVDTSKALSNWQVGIGQKPTSDIPPYVPGRFGSTRGASVGEAIAEGIAKLKRKKPGQTIYISNLTPYIGELDRGSSRQFAGNFRARARIIARKFVGKDKAEVK